MMIIYQKALNIQIPNARLVIIWNAAGIAAFLLLVSRWLDRPYASK